MFINLCFQTLLFKTVRMALSNYAKDCVPMKNFVMNIPQSLDLLPDTVGEDMVGPVNGFKAALRLIHDLWFYPNAEWRRIREKVLIGIIKDTVDHGNTSVSMGAAKRFFQRNSRNFIVTFINCGTGGNKYQTYCCSDTRIFLLCEHKPKNGANLNNLITNGYTPKKVDSVEVTRNALKKELRESHEKILENAKKIPGISIDSIQTIGFITGPFRQAFEEAKVEVKAVMESLALSVFNEFALPLNDNSFFLPQDSEGTLELSGTNCMYENLTRANLLPPCTQVIGSLGIGRGSCQWMINSVFGIPILNGLPYGMSNAKGLATLSDVILEQLMGVYANRTNFFEMIRSCQRPVIALKSGAGILLDSEQFMNIRNTMTMTFVNFDNESKEEQEVGPGPCPGPGLGPCALAIQQSLDQALSLYGMNSGNQGQGQGQGQQLQVQFHISNTYQSPPKYFEEAKNAPRVEYSMNNAYLPPAYSWPLPVVNSYTEKEISDMTLDERGMITFEQLRRTLGCPKFKNLYEDEIKRCVGSKPDVKNFPVLVAAMKSGLAHIMSMEDCAIRSGHIDFYKRQIVSFASELKFATYSKNASAAVGVCIDTFEKNPHLDYIIFIKGATNEVTCQLVFRDPMKSVVTLADDDLKGVSFSFLTVRGTFTPGNNMGNCDEKQITDAITNYLENTVVRYLNGRSVTSLIEAKKMMIMCYVGGPLRDSYEMRQRNLPMDIHGMKLIDDVCVNVLKPLLAKYKVQNWNSKNSSYIISTSDENWAETVAVKVFNENILPGCECVSVGSLGKVFAIFSYNDPSGQAQIVKHESGLESPKQLYDEDNIKSFVSISETTRYHFEKGNNQDSYSMVLKNSKLPLMCLKGGFTLVFKMFPSLLKLLLTYKTPSPFN